MVVIFLLGVPAWAKAAVGRDESEARKQSDFNVGVLAGLGIFGDSTTDFPLAAEAEYKFARNWGAGVYLSYDGMGSVSLPGVSASSSLYIAGAEGAYHFDRILNGVCLGAIVGTGLTWTSAKVGALSVTHSTLGLTFGPVFRYDYRLSGRLSAGTEFNYLIDANSAGAQVLNIVNVMGTLRLWL